MEHLVARTFPPDVRSVGEARRMVREALRAAHAEHFIESAELAISELVTNAVVHAGTETKVIVRTTSRGVRAEVADGSRHAPVPKTWSPTAGTGRGMHLVAGSVDRWHFIVHPTGKTVWFEIGDVSGLDVPGSTVEGTGQGSSGDQPTLAITLLNVPLLMHWAWQEHASALLRELLLFAIETDEDVVENHARASDALSVLSEQLPVPELPEDPEALLDSATGAAVTADQLVLRVPASSVANFVVLGDLLGRAIDHSKAGHLLGPPTQPEMVEMRLWLCQQVAEQAAGEVAPQPWSARTDANATRRDPATVTETYQHLAHSSEALIATDIDSIIVAVTAPALRLLGYEHTGQLVGQRIIVVVPERFHQAHIAGTTLHVTNGRSALLDREVTVPVVRADGTELAVRLLVTPTAAGDGRRAFVARLDPADESTL